MDAQLVDCQVQRAARTVVLNPWAVAPSGVAYQIPHIRYLRYNL